MEKAATVKGRVRRAKILILDDFNHREINWINKFPQGGEETWRAKDIGETLSADRQQTS